LRSIRAEAIEQSGYAAWLYYKFSRSVLETVCAQIHRSMFAVKWTRKRVGAWSALKCGAAPESFPACLSSEALWRRMEPWL
jgi:hypothetical protein